MSYAADLLYETVIEKPHAVDDGWRRFAFGRPHATTELYPVEKSSTQELDIQKTIQVEPEKAPASKLTAASPASVLGSEYFKPIKNWEGVVESVSDGEFVGTMREVGNPLDRGDEQFEISMEDVAPGDRALVVPGGIFYFTVGYRIRRGGTRIKGTQIVFRRIPLWSKRDLQRVQDRTEELLRILGEGRKRGDARNRL